jgi:hypothetical protein
MKSKIFDRITATAAPTGRPIDPQLTHLLGSAGLAPPASSAPYALTAVDAAFKAAGYSIDRRLWLKSAMRAAGLLA